MRAATRASVLGRLRLSLGEYPPRRRACGREIFGAQQPVFDTRRTRRIGPREAACGVLWVRAQCCRAGYVGGCLGTQLCALKNTISFAELHGESKTGFKIFWDPSSKDVQSAAQSTAAPMRVASRAARAARLPPGAGWHCCASGGAPLAPAGRDRCSGGASPRHGSRRSRSHSDRAAPLGGRCQSVLHHGAPGRSTTGGRSRDTDSARKVPRPQHHA